jgi:acetyl-CoA C-acetyltransferase
LHGLQSRHLGHRPRTPFGRLGGALASLERATLGGEAIRAALERSGLDPFEVEHVIMGMVLQGGAGQAPARQAAYKAGLAKTVTFETINKVCASGMIASCTARADRRRRR